MTTGEGVVTAQLLGDDLLRIKRLINGCAVVSVHRVLQLISHRLRQLIIEWQVAAMGRWLDRWRLQDADTLPQHLWGHLLANNTFHLQISSRNLQDLLPDLPLI